MAEKTFHLFFKIRSSENFLYNDDAKDDQSNDVHTGKIYYKKHFSNINPSQGGDWRGDQGGAGAHQGGDDRTGEVEEGGPAPSDVHHVSYYPSFI